MGNVRGGDIRQAIIAGREFDVAADANIKIMLSGLNNETNLNGNGRPHTTQKRMPGGFDDLELSIDDTNSDQEFIQTIANAGEPVPMTLTLASGITYGGALVIEGEIGGSKGDGKLTIAARGAVFEQI